jgi:hypothetical protein
MTPKSHLETTKAQVKSGGRRGDRTHSPRIKRTEPPSALVRGWTSGERFCWSGRVRCAVVHRLVSTRRHLRRRAAAVRGPAPLRADVGTSDAGSPAPGREAAQEVQGQRRPGAQGAGRDRRGRRAALPSGRGEPDEPLRPTKHPTAEFETSLQRLGLDHVDLCLMHQPCGDACSELVGPEASFGVASALDR